MVELVSPPVQTASDAGTQHLRPSQGKRYQAQDRGDSSHQNRTGVPQASLIASNSFTSPSLVDEVNQYDGIIDDNSNQSDHPVMEMIPRLLPVTRCNDEPSSPSGIATNNKWLDKRFELSSHDQEHQRWTHCRYSSPIDNQSSAYLRRAWYQRQIKVSSAERGLFTWTSRARECLHLRSMYTGDLYAGQWVEYLQFSHPLLLLGLLDVHQSRPKRQAMKPLRPAGLLWIRRSAEA